MTDKAFDQVDPIELFSGKPQFDNFCRMKDLFKTKTMEPSSKPYIFPSNHEMDLPSGYTFADREVSTKTFIAETDTSALLVLKGGSIVDEQYRLTGNVDVNWISWSVNKSFVSALVGIAIAEGHIKSIEETISTYIPVEPGSAYDGVRIKDVLQMSSGARWLEDYSNPDCDIFRLAAASFGEGSHDAFVSTMPRELEPGTLNRYNSADTQALGYMLTQATGRSLADYGWEKLWNPLGMEYPTYWIADSKDREMAYGGLNMAARDYAKLGDLYRRGGDWNGNQIIPADWVKASVTPDSPHLMAEKNGLGYGYQWWIPDGDMGEFSAIGVYNQFIYVNPEYDVVIVKLSATPTYGTTATEESNREMETIEFLRAIAKAA